MKISDEGVQFIAEFEGFSSKPYLDAVKVPTIGYGTTVYPNGKKVTMSDPSITKEAALDYLGEHISKYADPVLVKYPKLNQAQYDALASFIYNLGNRLTGSTLERYIRVNASCDMITSAFKMWNKASGKVLAGLTRRRLAEANLYCTGNYK